MKRVKEWDTTSKLFTGALFSCGLVLSPFILDFTLSPRQIVLALLLLVLCWKQWRTAVPGPFALSWPAIVLTLHFLFYALSAAWAINKHEAGAEAMRQLLWAGLFLLSLRLFQEKKDELFQKVAWAAALLCLALFLVFIVQLFQAGTFSKESMYSITGINGHKNLFSSFLFLLLTLVLMQLQGDTGRRRLLTAAAIAACLIILTLRTKAVWLAIGSGAVIYFLLILFRRREIKTWAVLASTFILSCLSIFLLVFLLPKVTTKALNDLKAQNELMQIIADEERLLLWQKSFEMVKGHQVYGVGANNWQVALPKVGLSGLYRAEDLNFTFQRPHNDLIWIYSESGFIGIFLWLGGLILLLGLLLKNILSAEGPEKKKLALLFSSITGFIVIGLFDFPRERTEHMAWFMVLLAFAVYKTENRLNLPKLRLRSAALLFCLIVFFALACWAGILRYKGELFTRKMYQEKSRTNNPQVIVMAKKAASLLYSLDPTSVPLPWYSGNAHAELRQFDKALEDFKEAYYINPYSRNVLSDLGSAYVSIGDTLKAIELYREAARISPRFDEAKLNLATVYYSQRKYRQAAEVLATLMHDSTRRTQLQMLTAAALALPTP